LPSVAVKKVLLLARVLFVLIPSVLEGFVLAFFLARVLVVLIPSVLNGFVLAFFLARLLFVLCLLVTLSQETVTNS
jgi:hypothetical protein